MKNEKKKKEEKKEEKEKEEEEEEEKKKKKKVSDFYFCSERTLQWRHQPDVCSTDPRKARNV